MMFQRSTAFSKKPNSNKKDFLVKMFIYMENCGGNYHRIGSLRNAYNSARVNGDISVEQFLASYPVALTDPIFIRIKTTKKLDKVLLDIVQLVEAGQLDISESTTWYDITDKLNYLIRQNVLASRSLRKFLEISPFYHMMVSPYVVFTDLVKTVSCNKYHVELSDRIWSACNQLLDERKTYKEISLSTVESKIAYLYYFARTIDAMEELYCKSDSVVAECFNWTLLNLDSTCDF